MKACQTHFYLLNHFYLLKEICLLKIGRLSTPKASALMFQSSKRGQSFKRAPSFYH